MEFVLQTCVRSRPIKGHCTTWCGCSSPFKFSKQPRYRPCARPRRSSPATAVCALFISYLCSLREWEIRGLVPTVVLMWLCFSSLGLALALALQLLLWSNGTGLADGLLQLQEPRVLDHLQKVRVFSWNTSIILAWNLRELIYDEALRSSALYLATSCISP
jgi:hypothetical protein